MAWWHAFTRRAAALPNSAAPDTYGRSSLTAAATAVQAPRTELLRNTESWQEEAWGYYDSLGEFRYGIEWEAAMLSRIRLYAGKLEPGEDEPARADAGPAVDLMTAFGGGTTGQTDIMSSLGTQLGVPGEGYLIGEKIGGVEQWTVRSVDEVRVRNQRFEVMDEESASSGTLWRPLTPDSLPVRVHRPHKRWRHLADSPARAARGTMRELELVNRHILAQYLSRLASAGVWFVPDEVTFPVREEFEDSVDPFMSEWIEIAAEAIRTPGTASATVPIPIRVPAELIGKFQHLDFTLKIDDKVIEKRDSAIKRLATQLNIPAEILLGMGDLNHWGAWAVDEAALKTNIAPEAELICGAITKGYLQPRLKASRVPDFDRWVAWYDMSELTLRPDRSADAIQLYDRMEINGAALRRETGFDESDKPDKIQLSEQGLKIIVRTQPMGAPSALSELTGEASISPDTAASETTADPPAEPPPADRSIPDTGNAPPPSDGASRDAARADRMMQQATALHAVRFSTGASPELLHPATCAKHAYSCPFTHEAVRLHMLPRPGTSGTYECRLDTFGRLSIGRLAPHLDTSTFLTTRSSNGYARR